MNNTCTHENITAETKDRARSVAGIACRNGLIFVARRKADTTEMSLRWEFPGGKVEFKESDQQALTREFLEEFNACIHVKSLLGESIFVHRGKTRTLAAWEIDLEPESVAVLQEHCEAAWLPLDVIAELDLADSDKSLLPFIGARA